jgi:hypothetical protein
MKILHTNHTIMKSKNTLSKSSLGIAATCIMLTGAAHGATLLAGGTTTIVPGASGSVDDDYVISVNATNSGFANDSASVSGTFAGTIESYRFVNVTGGNGNRDLTTVVESGGLVGLMTSTDEADNNGFDSFGQNALHLYTTTDPGSLLDTSPARNFTAGIRDLDDFTGTVDISGIDQGSIYLFYGSYNAGGVSLTAIMTDTEEAESPIASGQLFGGSPGIQQNIYVTKIDFVNDLGYDTITYTSDGSRLIGAVVTSIPEPSTTALLGLGGLALIMRRRK